ncbi:hypothetical protein ACQYRI_12675 [Salmonella enterica]
MQSNKLQDAVDKAETVNLVHRMAEDYPHEMTERELSLLFTLLTNLSSDASAELAKQNKFSE